MCASAKCTSCCLVQMDLLRHRLQRGFSRSKVQVVLTPMHHAQESKCSFMLPLYLDHFQTMATQTREKISECWICATYKHVDTCIQFSTSYQIKLQTMLFVDQKHTYGHFLSRLLFSKITVCHCILKLLKKKKKNLVSVKTRWQKKKKYIYQEMECKQQSNTLLSKQTRVSQGHTRHLKDLKINRIILNWVTVTGECKFSLPIHSMYVLHKIHLRCTHTHNNCHLGFL